jgi:hypothetical protein
MPSTVLITAPSFDETSEFALDVAVVDTQSLAGVINHCEGSVISVQLVGFTCTLWIYCIVQEIIDLRFP